MVWFAIKECSAVSSLLKNIQASSIEDKTGVRAISRSEVPLSEHEAALSRRIRHTSLVLVRSFCNKVHFTSLAFHSSFVQN
ncbi:Protein of unknown function [Pyronema omphalodes CBS 100304]|uniref:Uncharacterized protein n=1 Tax=Pyronema omphalodes (strain CBS 100304) TaxID=1076935 RepID=U4LI26_PYROM|nr:Protein of unknown function [Pyronema omphalodes CBS 100304]